ncbi:MAG: hypothetical protein HY075_02165 [Deltaproteobacteria bacterium]|nr:hypothetical protein [Deltaproteobacteria bacterium]
MRRSDLALLIAWCVFSIWLWGSRAHAVEPPPIVLQQQQQAEAKPAVKPAPAAERPPSKPFPQLPPANPAPAAAPAAKPAPAVPAKPATASSAAPASSFTAKSGSIPCTDVLFAYDSVPSSGPLNVPVTIDGANPGKDLEVLKSINRSFKPEQVEQRAFDAIVDTQSHSAAGAPGSGRTTFTVRCCATTNAR